MHRRQLLATAGAGIATATTGCLGYTIQSTDEIDRRQSKINELEDNIAQKENKINEVESELNSIQDDNTELEEKVTELENDVTDTQSEQILWLYSYALTHYNNGVDKYESGSDFFGEENYIAARAELNVAAGYLESATNNFNAASDRAFDYEEDTVESYCVNASSKSDQFTQACSDYQLGSYYYTQSEDSTARDYIDDGDAHYSDMQSYQLRDLDRLEDELGTTIDV